MRAVGKNVMIEKDPKEEVTAGGIIIPTKKESNTGTVISIGHKVQFLKEGQRVMYHPSQLVDVELDGKNCGFIKEDSCIAIL